MLPQDWKGLITAVFTPMHSDGSLRLEQVPAIVEHLLRHKMAGIYAAGSTGEGVSLTIQERQDVAAAYVRAAAGRMPVLVQVGHTSLAEARGLAAHAQRIGAAAISAVPPFYFKPSSPDNLVACMAEIAAGAPDLPFYYYHIPSLTNCPIDMVEFLQRASDRIPTLAGVKFTSPNFYEMQACIETFRGRYRMYNGLDEILLAGLSTGAHGAVGSTYNYAPAVYNRLLAAFDRGDLAEARQWQARSVDMVRVILSYRGLAGQKAVMGLIGLDCGPTRLPWEPLSAQELGQMRSQLAAIGFFDWALDSSSR